MATFPLPLHTTNGRISLMARTRKAVNGFWSRVGSAVLASVLVMGVGGSAGAGWRIAAAATNAERATIELARKYEALEKAVIGDADTPGIRETLALLQRDLAALAKRVP